MNKEEKENEKKLNKELDENQGKFIRISIEADAALTELHKNVNSQDDAIKVTKVMLASYVLEKHCPQFGDDDIKVVYMKHVSEVDLLRIAYKRAMDSGIIPENLKEILFANAGLAQGMKKSKKSRQSNGSNATVDELEAS